MSDAEVPQPKPEGGEQLNIKVKDADGNEVFFKVKRTTKLSKLKKAYAERMGKPENSVRFIFDGQRIGDNDTAETVSNFSLAFQPWVASSHHRVSLHLLRTWAGSSVQELSANLLTSSLSHLRTFPLLLLLASTLGLIALQLNMEDQDEIDAMIEQLGGC